MDPEILIRSAPKCHGSPTLLVTFVCWSAGIEAIRAGLASWDWIYGKTPKFSIASTLQARRGGEALSLQLRNGGRVLLLYPPPFQLPILCFGLEPGSVADPEFYPGIRIFPSRIRICPSRIQDQKATDTGSGSATKTCYEALGNIIRDVYSGSGFFPSRIRISDPGVRKALDRGSGFAVSRGFTSCTPGFPETAHFHISDIFGKSLHFPAKPRFISWFLNSAIKPRGSPDQGGKSREHQTILNEKICEKMKTTSFG